MTSAIIVAAGSGTRMKTKKKKQFLEINGTPVVAHTIFAFEKSHIIDEIIIVTANEDIDDMADIAEKYGFKKVAEIVAGGKTRTESVRNGLCAARGEIVAIHDGVRPCISSEHIKATIEAAEETGAAALGCRVTDTIKKADEKGFITATVDRSDLWAIQTPQVFKKDILLKAYDSGNTQGATDDCMLVESIGVRVLMVEGSRNNIKVTLPEDIDLVSSILQKESQL